MEEDNKLIAEFMGAELDISCAHYDNCKIDPTTGSPNNGYRRYDKMEYKSSWDWLMPVLEKCFPKWEFETFHSQNRFAGASIIDGCLQWHITVTGNTPIESHYKAVVKFIKWYNKTK